MSNHILQANSLCELNQWRHLFVSNFILGSGKGVRKGLRVVCMALVITAECQGVFIPLSANGFLDPAGERFTFNRAHFSNNVFFKMVCLHFSTELVQVAFFPQDVSPATITAWSSVRERRQSLSPSLSPVLLQWACMC